MKIFYCSVVLLALVAFVLAVGILKPTFRFKNGIMHKQAMQLTSSAFSEGQTLPSRFSYGGGNVNPPLAWSGAPEGTRSFALIMDDPDVPKGVGVPIWIHWIVFNIPSSATGIPEAAHLVGVRGKGTSGSVDYYGPRPPDKEHRYFFRLYALDSVLDLGEGATAGELQTAMTGHILAKAALMGRYAPN